ncbi:MAG: sugar phosphate isomerase/epimerase [Caldilineaceae bacterium]|nr:sugar phosphate isomerase/epimerase [Caldilineaceae bacterium]
MRLGVVGMVPGDLRAIAEKHLKAVQALDLTAACFHGAGDRLFDVTSADCERVRRLYTEMGMDLPQFGVGYNECLFDPNASVRDAVVRKIGRGIEVGRELGAHVALIRTGSLSPDGSYAPSRKNHTPDGMERLIETLRRVADKAEAEGQTIVIETHVTTIMNSPEVNRDVVEAVGSERIRIVMDYVNHFQMLSQVFNSAERINHIFDVMGPISVVAHCKDISVRNGFVVHFDEEIPGEGELDLATALRRWHELRPDGYMLLEHLPNELYPLAARNTQRIAKEAGVPIH